MKPNFYRKKILPTKADRMSGRMSYHLLPEQRTEIFRLYAADESISSIARKFNCTRRNIEYMLITHNIPKRGKGRKRAHNKKVTDEIKSEIIEMAIQKIHRNIISETIGKKYGIVVTPGHISGLLSAARDEGIKIPYYLPNYTRAAPVKRSKQLEAR